MLSNSDHREGRRPTEDRFGDPARDRSRSPVRGRIIISPPVRSSLIEGHNHAEVRQHADQPYDLPRGSLDRRHPLPQCVSHLFSNLIFHIPRCSSGDQFRRYRDLLKIHGARGTPYIKNADWVFVIPDRSSPYMTISSGRVHGDDDFLDWRGVCHRYARRLEPIYDDKWARMPRKKVVQADWIDESVVVRTQVPVDLWEIKVDNSHLAHWDQSPAPPRETDHNMPDMQMAPTLPFDQTIPSFEYHADLSLTPPALATSSNVTSSSMQVPPNTHPAGAQSSSSSNHDVARQTTPPTLHHADPTHPRSSSHQETRAPPRSTHRPMTPPLPAVSLPRATLLEAEPSHQQSSVADGVPESPSVCATHSRTTPAILQKPSAARVYDAMDTTLYPSRAPSQPARIPVHESSLDPASSRAAAPTGQDRQGIFARDQVLPWTFHVIDAERHRLAVMNITHFGGGLIVPLARAAIVVIPESGVREANTRELRELVDSVGDGRAVVSIDWITQCIQEDQRVDLTPYRITYEPEECEVDIKMEEEAGTVRQPASPLNLQWQGSETAPVRLLTRSVSPQPPQASVPAETSHFVKEEITEEPMEEPVIEEPAVSHNTEDDDDDDDFFMIVDYIPPTKDIIRGTSDRDAFPTPPRTPATESTRSASPSYSESLTSLGEADSEEDIPKSTRMLAVKDPRQTQPTIPMIADPEQQRQLLDILVAPDDMIPFVELKERLRRWGSEGFPGTQKKFLADIREEKPQFAWDSIYRIYNKLYYQTVPGLEAQGNPKLRGTKMLRKTGQETKRKRASKRKTATSKSSSSKAPEQKLASMFVPTTKYL